MLSGLTHGIASWIVLQLRVRVSRDERVDCSYTSVDLNTVHTQLWRKLLVSWTHITGSLRHMLMCGWDFFLVEFPLENWKPSRIHFCSISRWEEIVLGSRQLLQIGFTIDALSCLILTDTLPSNWWWEWVFSEWRFFVQYCSVFIKTQREIFSLNKSVLTGMKVCEVKQRHLNLEIKWVNLRNFRHLPWAEILPSEGTSLLGLKLIRATGWSVDRVSYEARYSMRLAHHV